MTDSDYSAVVKLISEHVLQAFGIQIYNSIAAITVEQLVFLSIIPCMRVIFN